MSDLRPKLPASLKLKPFVVEKKTRAGDLSIDPPASAPPPTSATPHASATPPASPSASAPAATTPPAARGRDGNHQVESRSDILRVAAIAAVLSMIDSSGPDPALIGRQQGSSWAQDHRQLASGNSGVMRNRQSRSTWR